MCNLDNLLQKNIIVFFFGNEISKWRSIENRAIFDLLHTFLVTREKLQKFLQHISHSHTYMYFAHPITAYWLFCLTNFEKNTNIRYNFSLVWLVLILICAILEHQRITKWWAKFKLECLLLICVYTNAKFIVICKPRTLNGGGEDSVQYRNRKKHCFLAAAILLFIGKIIITW